jgi:hypothetical protein
MSGLKAPRVHRSLAAFVVSFQRSNSLVWHPQKISCSQNATSTMLAQ